MGWDRKVPIDPRTGDLLHYAEGFGSRDAIWMDVYEFDATLEFQGWERGRSAVYAWMKDVGTGRRFPLSLHELTPFMKTISNGQIIGRWTFRKIGQNFFLIPVR